MAAAAATSIVHAYILNQVREPWPVGWLVLEPDGTISPRVEVEINVEVLSLAVGSRTNERED